MTAEVPQPFRPVPRRWLPGRGSVHLAGSGLATRVAAFMILGAALLGVAARLDGAGRASSASAVDVGNGDQPTPLVGGTAPGFRVVTVAGSAVQLSTLRGQPVWLVFGASWCQPCRAESPDIEAAYEAARPSGLVVVEVFVSEDAATVADYGGRVGLDYELVADPDARLANAYRIVGFPTHYFVDRTGTIVAITDGGLDRPGMDASLDLILP